MEEPFGKFGAMNPTGHAAVYLNHVCAESPTELRMCEPGEYGVVISRYHKIHKYDWIAIPLIPYLYAVEDATDIPATVDKAQVAASARCLSPRTSAGPRPGQQEGDGAARGVDSVGGVFVRPDYPWIPSHEYVRTGPAVHRHLQ